jgi:ATP-binding cassette, subfamily C (CFTR/MRP), member 1
MIRGGFVALLFEQSMRLDLSAHGDNAAVTLMSTDLEGIAPGVEVLHEFWACFIELGIAMYLLYRQVGASFFLVAIPAVGKSPCCGYLLALDKTLTN